MSLPVNNRGRVSRRSLLQGFLSGAPVIVGLPPLISRCNAEPGPQAVERRFVLWFNGNGIPERYWIPDQTGANYDLPPCLTPLARLRDEVHVLSGLDNSAIGNASGDGHSTAMSALMTCTHF